MGCRLWLLGEPSPPRRLSFHPSKLVNWKFHWFDVFVKTSHKVVAISRAAAVGVDVAEEALAEAGLLPPKGVSEFSAGRPISL